MHVFRDKDVLLPTGHDDIVSPPPGKAAHTFLFHDGFWKSDHDFQLMIHSNFLASMHGFQDNEVVLPTGYDMTSSSDLRQGRFTWFFMTWFWKSDYDFLIVMHNNFLSVMHGFQDNEVFLQADMTSSWFISSPGGASVEFSWRILKMTDSERASMTS